MENRRTHLDIYTADGSKLNDPNEWATGGGYVFHIKHPSEPWLGLKLCAASLTICHTQTVFMVEIRSITEARRIFLQLRAEKQIATPASIIIHSES